MVLSFIHSVQSEWIKKRRSLASVLVITGAFFSPLIFTIYRIVHSEKLPAAYAGEKFWYSLWNSCWQSMAFLLLPVGVILATSLITQLEFKNNTWKQLHTTPLRLTTIFFSKLTVILTMLLQFFILFNIGISLAAYIPYLVIRDIPYPKAEFPAVHFLQQNAYYFIDCLPIVAFQYLISLKYKNFIVPLGAGFLMWAGALTLLPWKYSHFLPYTYGMFNYTIGEGRTGPAVNIHLMAIGYFVVLTAVGYVLYITNREKG